VISRPTTSQLVDVVRNELSNHVGPHVADPELTVALQMVDQVLATIARRADHEIAWMHEEIAAIEAAAEELVTTHPDAGGVAAALDEHRSRRTGSLHLADVTDDYNRASEVLSRAVEFVIGSGGAHQERIMALLSARLDHEVEVMGADFTLVGRA
jgi:hypothetical protein